MNAAAVLEAIDRTAVEACVRTYFESWFAGEPDSMRAVLHPELAKRGFVEEGGQPGLERETSDSMVAYTSLAIGSKHPASKRWFEIDIVDLYEDIASVVVRSAIYREYVHLVRTEAGWRILNCLWRHTIPEED